MRLTTLRMVRLSSMTSTRFPLGSLSIPGELAGGKADDMGGRLVIVVGGRA